MKNYWFLSILPFLFTHCLYTTIATYSSPTDFYTNWAYFDSSTSSYSSTNLWLGSSDKLWRMFEKLPFHQQLMIQIGVKLQGSLAGSTFIISIQVDSYSTSTAITVLTVTTLYWNINKAHTNLQTLIEIQVSTSDAAALWYIDSLTLKTYNYLQKEVQYPLNFGEYSYFLERNFNNNEGWLDSHNTFLYSIIPNFTLLCTSATSRFQLEKIFYLPYKDLTISLDLFVVSLASPITFININSYSFVIAPYILMYYTEASTSKLFFYQQISITQKITKSTKILIRIQKDSQFGIRDFKLQYKIDEKQDKLIPGCLNQIDQECWNCDDGWKLLNNIKICQPICGDGIIKYYEECDDGNIYPYDGCHFCKFSCPKNCLICKFGKCLKFKNIIETYPDQYSCKEDSIFPNSGRYYDQNFGTCLSICGDGIISLNEQCDDGNDYPYDGCFQCQYQCDPYCDSCIEGICQYCNFGFRLINQKCEVICGDAKVILYELCDDDNQVQFDGCHNCQYSCQKGCQYCLNTFCLECFEGWNLVSGQCEQQCHDNQVAILSIEQCDDDSLDYCVDCEVRCKDANCNFCTISTFCTKCYSPFSSINGLCLPLCGDGMLHSDFEQCDDGNSVSNDGCFNCRFECKKGCLECNQELQCLQCDLEEYTYDELSFQCLKIIIETPEEEEEKQEEEVKEISIICADNEIFVDDTCVSLCGNQIVNEEFEYCDDGNRNGGDGCSFDCKIEDSYVCISPNNLMSTCSFVIQPKFLLTSLSDIKNQTQIVEISFSEQVKLNNLFYFEEISKFSIQPDIEVNLHLVPIINASTILANVRYNVLITFLNSINSPVLDVTLMKNIFYSKSDLELKNNQQTISLGSPFVLTEETQTKVDSVKDMNNIMIYSMSGIGGYALLTGNSYLLFNLLDLLQQLSYLKYMQYPFPIHLKQFLDTYSKISLQPILDRLKIDEYLANLNGGSLPFIGKTNKKSTQKQVNQLNQYYLLNAKSCYFSFLISISTQIICSLVISKRFQSFILNKILIKKNRATKFKQKLFIINQEIRNKCYSIKYNYFFKGVLQYYQAILHQFSFSIFLQFPYYQFDSTLNIINSINAILALLLILCISFKSFSLISEQNKNVSKWKYFFEENKPKYWSMYLKSFQMLKTLNYILIIVVCMDFPEIQSFLLSIQSLIYILYLIRHSPLKSKLEQAKLILRDGMVAAIVGSFYGYSFELNDDQILIFGWIHIGMFIFLMAGTLTIDIIKQILDFKANYLRERRIKQLRKEALYYNNPLQKFIQANERGIQIQ